MIKKEEENIIYEQISIFSKDNFIITLQELEGDVFDPLRDRIKDDKGIIRKKDKDYLFYALIDIILDNYFVFMMNIEKSIESLEEEAMINEEDNLLKDIYYYKKELVKLRNSIIPMKEIIKTLKDSAAEEDYKYYEDLFDHIYFMIDSLNVFREMINGIYEIYISNISNRMNKIMTVLTIFSAVFIPMTFLAGVYGMNFRHIPGLDNPNSFFIFISVCVAIFLGMIYFFRRKKWL
jgi:magnesium transporter